MNFYEKTKKVCKIKKDITLGEMVKKLNLSTSMPTKWKNGLIPNGETLIKIADFLDESIDYLLGRDQKQEDVIITNDALNPKIHKITHLLETEDIPDEIINFIYNALENYKK